MTDLEIRYFLEIVNQGISFSKASGALYISQPALTRHINTLNKELEAKLFDTSNRNNIRLTPAGELYYRFFSKTADQFKKIKGKAKTLSDEHYGDLRIGCVEGWDMRTLSASKKAFYEAHPYVALSIYSGGFKEIRNGLLNNQFDLLVTFPGQFQGMPNIGVHDISRIPCILLFSNDHPLARKKSLEITCFKDEPFYIITEEEFPQNKYASYCKSKGFIPRFQPMPNLDSILVALQNGTGYTIVSTWLREKDSVAFKYLSLDMTIRVSYVWRKDNNNRALSLFLETGVLNSAPLGVCVP